MAEEQKETKKEAPSGPKVIMGLPLLLFIFFTLNILVTLGALGLIIHSQLIYKKPPITDDQVETELQKKIDTKKVDSEKASVFTEVFPPMTINLRGQQGGRGHFASVETVILCPTDVCLAQVKTFRAVIEDSIQESIGAHSLSEMASLETKFRIKHEILSKVNSLLKGTAATEVLFTSFVVQ